MSKNYLIINGKQYTIFEFLVSLILVSYLLTSLYLFFKILPDLIINLENSSKAISDLELSIIEIKKNSDIQIKELQNTISLLQENNTSEFNNNFIKSFYNINWKYVVYFLALTGVCIYGYSLYHNFNLIQYLGNQTNSLLYYLGLKDEKIEFLFSNPELSEHVVRAILKNKSVISEITVRHISSTEFTPILDYLKTISDIAKNTRNDEAVNYITKEVDNLVIRRTPRR